MIDYKAIAQKIAATREAGMFRQFHMSYSRPHLHFDRSVRLFNQDVMSENIKHVLWLNYEYAE